MRETARWILFDPTFEESTENAIQFNSILDSIMYPTDCSVLVLRHTGEVRTPVTQQTALGADPPAQPSSALSVLADPTPPADLQKSRFVGYLGSFSGGRLIFQQRRKLRRFRLWR